MPLLGIGTYKLDSVEALHTALDGRSGNSGILRGGLLCVCVCVCEREAGGEMLLPECCGDTQRQ